MGSSVQHPDVAELGGRTRVKCAVDVASQAAEEKPDFDVQPAGG